MPDGGGYTYRSRSPQVFAASLVLLVAIFLILCILAETPPGVFLGSLMLSVLVFLRSLFLRVLVTDEELKVYSWWRVRRVERSQVSGFVILGYSGWWNRFGDESGRFSFQRYMLAAVKSSTVMTLPSTMGSKSTLASLEAEVTRRWGLTNDGESAF